jgi:hypothetical protein
MTILYLVTVGMTTDDNTLGPAWHQARDVLADDGFTKHCATQDVTDRPIGRLPHLLQLEF